MKRIQIALALALSIVLSSCASRGPRPTPEPPPPPTATLAIVAVNDRTGAPIEGARFDVQWTETIDDGRTNADGYVAINGNPLEIPFAIEVVADGYRLFSTDVTLSGNQQLEARLVPLGESSVGEAPWPGRLAIGPGARCYVDGAGACQLPVFAHFGEAFSKYVRDPELVRDQLRAIKRAGYDGIRFWDTLGYYQEVWRDREVMPWDFTARDGRRVPATPNYYDRLREFLVDLKAIGLAAHHSRGDLNGQSTQRVVDHAERVAQLYDQVGLEGLALAEGNNEDFQNGDFRAEGLRRIVAPFKARGAITALSAPPGTVEEPDELREYSADVFYVHGHRTGGHVDIIRHIFSLIREQASGTPRLGWQGEPAGPGSGVSVGRVNEPEALALMAAEALTFRQAWVYMSGFGVFYNGRIESQPGFAAVPKIARALEDFAPDVMSWRATHRSAGDAVLRSDRPLEDGARVDQAIAGDGRVVAIAYDARGGQGVRNETGRPLSCDVVGVSGNGPDEELTRATVALAPGQTLPLQYSTGRLLLCRPAA